MDPNGAIAIVGLACRFPGAPDASAFWANILGDVCSIRPLPASRFHRDRYFDPEIGAYAKSYSDLGGLVEEKAFDARAFRMPPKLIESTDVAHLWALEVARSALEDAGYDPFDLAGRNVGVVVGHARGSMVTADMAFSTAVEGMLEALDGAPALAALGLERLAEVKRRVADEVHARYPRRTEDGSIGTMTSALAAIISQSFGFTGRHMVVDAACASSFAAIDIAARALLDGRLDAAIAGGASYSQELSVIMFAQSRALSPDGSFPFDRRANGFISSDGIGLFILRRLEDALRDGNRIRAVIRGIGGSCDGKGKALWAPRREGQVLAMRRAYETFGLNPAETGLIEAHATGTPLGDRTEVEALHEVFVDRVDFGPMPIGSVKGNIGHAREAAGAAGLVKAILALEHATIPPTGGFRDPSPDIPWSDLAVEVATAPRPWVARGVRRAGVNAFGIGGLNYHVVVEEAPPEQAERAASRRRAEAHSRSGAEASWPERRSRAAGAPRLEPSSSTPRPVDIAIVGVGGRFPGARDAGAFWNLLVEGKDAAIDVPRDRWNAELYHRPKDRAPHRTYLKKGAFVTGFEADWKRYKIPPRLIEQSDPLQFMLLDSALEALDDAGVDPEAIDRTRVAVLVGSVFGSDYALSLSLAIRAEELAEDVANALGESPGGRLYEEAIRAIRAPLPVITEDSSGSFSSSTLASRISKTLDLMGPSFAVDAACASSFASLEIACEALRAGSVDLAIAGGGDRAMRVQRYEAYCQFHALSPDGAPKPFDERADGFLPGEGAAVCVLKRAEDAERDGDRVYAVIRAVGSSGDGEKKGMLKPSPRGLAMAIERALEAAGTAPEAVCFVECHGGATPLGDATEVEAVRRTYLRGARGEPLVLGTLKSSVGHTQGAASAMSVVKTALALAKGIIPPTRGFSRPHPDHRFGGELRVNVRAEPFRAAGGPVAAAVSSMGLGGINYHAVLERPASVDDLIYVLRASTADELVPRARDAGALFEARALGEGPCVATVAALDRADLARRLSLLERTGIDERAAPLLEKQGVFVRVRPPPGEDLASSPPLARVAFMFSGQGSQYPGMMKRLAEEVPAAARIARRVDTWLESERLPSITRRLFSGEALPDDVLSVQLAVLTADLMCWSALASAGLVPDVVTGHSYGDYAALVAARVWSIEDALRATRARSEAIIESASEGGMMSIAASREWVERALERARSEGPIFVANVNAPDQVVAAGARSPLEALERIAAETRIETRVLDVPRPFHSPLMAAAAPALERSLAGLALSAPARRYLSSVTGRYEEDPRAIRQSLVDQLTRPVDFVAQIERLVEDGIDALVECGPKGVLASLARRIAPSRDVLIVPTDDANEPGRWAVARAIAGLRARRIARAGAPAFPTKQISEGPPPARATYGRGAGGAGRGPPPVIASSNQPGVAGDRTRAHRQPTREDVVAFLIEAICAESGYPPDILDLDADLEADLGIDTVKQAQVLGKVRDRFDLATDERLALRDFPTIRHIADYVERAMSREGSAPRRSRVTVIDVTERRLGSRSTTATFHAHDHGVDHDHVPRSRETAERLVAIPAPSEVPAPGVARPVRVLHLEGGARDIGRQHGDALRDPILEVLDRYQSFVAAHGRSPHALPDAARYLRSFFDEASLEEVEGLAEAVGVDPLVLLAYNLDAALFPAFAPGCTQAVRLARDNGGALLHVANEDSPLFLHLGGVHPRAVQVRRRTDGLEPERRTVFLTLAGQIAGVNGASDSGLTVTSTTLLDGPASEELPAGLPHPQVVRRVLEEARSLAHAREIIARARRAGRWSVLVSDAGLDRALYVEYDRDAILVDEEVEGQRATTNHSILGSKDRADVPEHSRLREERAQRLLEDRSPLTVDRAKAFLRDRYDLGRKKQVAHPTMNTILRVDNVMSFVAEPSRRVLHVSDRVLPPGAQDDGVRFLTLEYGAHEAPAATEPVSRLGAHGAGIVKMPEIMRRHVVRAIAEPRDPAPASFAPKTALLVGRGPVADAIAQALAERGSRVRAFARAADALRAIEASGARSFAALGIVLPSEEVDPASLLPSAWRERRGEVLDGPFSVVRAWAPGAGSAGGTLFGVSFLGGGLGFENAAQGSGDHGGLLGLLKAVRREIEGLDVQALDASPTESPESIARALLTELDGGPERLEVGLLRGRRMRLALCERSSEADVGSALPAAWIVTGGARGVTARMCLRLAELYRPSLHLLGRQPLPDPATLEVWRSLDAPGFEAYKRSLLEEMRASEGFTPVVWKARAEAIDKVLEIDRHLRAIAERGARVRYHAVDVADPDGMRSTLETIREEDTIEGILHGAGVELAKPLEKKSAAIFDATVGAKVDGIVHLLRETSRDRITHVIAFSSVSGRFGGHGQTDYSLANEAMSRILSAHAARHPGRRVFSVSWPAFGEVGLAARDSSRIFLERAGQAFMSPDEGANHLVRELWSGAREPEVTVCGDLASIDLDRLLPRPDPAARIEVARAALLGAPVACEEDLVIVERRLEESDPFLDQHRMGDTPILPAVIALELLAEIAGDHGVLDLEIVRPLKLAGEGRDVRVVQRGDTLLLTSTARKPDGVVLEPDRVYARARRGQRLAPERRFSPVEAEGELLGYPYAGAPDRTPGSRAIYHGPVFRCLEGVIPGEDSGRARLAVPPIATLAPGSDPSGWRVHASLLDGCLQAVGMLARLLYGRVALPSRIGRVGVSPRALSATGERVWLEVLFTAHDERHVEADLLVIAADGPLLSVEGYAAQAVDP